MGIKSTIKLIVKAKSFYPKIPNKKYVNYILIGIFAAISLIAFSTIGSINTQSLKVDSNINLIGTKMPNIVFKKIDSDQIINSSSEIDGKQIIIFWNTTNPLSKVMINSISNNDLIKKGDIKFIAINIDDDDNFAQYFLKTSGLNSQNTFYGFKSLNNEGFRIHKVPEVYFVNKSIINDIEPYIQSVSLIQNFINDFNNDYKNINQTNYYEGTRLTVDQNKIQVACQSKFIDSSLIQHLPSSTNPSQDKGFQCLPLNKSPTFTSFENVENIDFKLIKVTIGKTTHLYSIDYMAEVIIVNDIIEGMPISVFFDPLSYTIHVFESIVKGKYTAFNYAGREFENSLLIYDNLTYSIWYDGISISGTQAGKTLHEIPFVFTSSNKILGIKAQLLAKSGAYKNEFEDYWLNDKFLYTSDFVQSKDAKEVISVVPNSIVKLGPNNFISKIEDIDYTFSQVDMYYKDDQTHSIWNIEGECIYGESKGISLERAVIKVGMKFNIKQL